MNPRTRFANNPFFVLGLEASASRAEVERTGQRLLAELAIGRESARYYRTPVGVEERSEERVRAALAELANPARRQVHEAWARVPLEAAEAAEAVKVDAPPAFPALTWADALRLFGARSPRKG